MKKFFNLTKAVFSAALVLAFLGMAACAKKSNNGASRVQNRGTGLPLNTNGLIGSNGTGIGTMYPGQTGGMIQNQGSCAGAQSMGRLVDDGSLYGSFRANYMEFLGEELGDLDGNVNSTSTGVNFQLRIKVNGQSIVPQQSGILIEVRDSWIGELGPAQVGFESAVNGNSGGTGNFNLTFEDGYGQVFVQGQLQGNIIQGRVYYQNSGMSQQKSLGTFSLNSCSVFY